MTSLPESAAVSSVLPSPTRVEWAAWLIAALALLAALLLHLLPALLAGLLVYELVHMLTPWAARFSSTRAKLIAVALVSGVVVLIVTVLVGGAVAFFRSDAGSLSVLFEKMAEILEGASNSMPAWLVQYLPSGPDDLKAAVVHWLREHSAEVQLAGKEIGLAFAHILIGMIIGAMASLREVALDKALRPLSAALMKQAYNLGDAFRRIVFAQVRISAVNTVFSAIYLMAVLPAFGVHLPLTKTMVAVTFLAGLLPVVGNLLSNTVIIVVSLSHSFHAAMASLVFLVVIHKLEYFLNARIVGSQIHARAWELLLAMLTMESMFGIAGVVAAPIYYAYLKHELASREMV